MSSWAQTAGSCSVQGLPPKLHTDGHTGGPEHDARRLIQASVGALPAIERIEGTTLGGREEPWCAFRTVRCGGTVVGRGARLETERAMRGGHRGRLRSPLRAGDFLAGGGLMPLG